MPIRVPPRSRPKLDDAVLRQGATAAPAAIPAALRAPEDVYAGLPAIETSPALTLKGSFQGWRFDPNDVDAVMKKYGVGDVKAVLKIAIALHIAARPGRVLSRDELEAAAKQSASYVVRGVRFSPVDLAEVMTSRGIAAESAMLRAARRVDDGDKVLTRAELEQAADLLSSIVKAHDTAEVARRLRAHEARGEVTVEDLGSGLLAATLPSLKQPPRLRVLVTGGVHGSEPCGTGAAMLTLQEALGMKALREDVELTFVPIVNPRGLAQGTRRTPEDVDLNRTFADDDAPAETGAMRGLFQRRVDRDGPFDVVCDLHSAKASRNGFFILHDDAQAAAAFAMTRFRETWPALSEDAAPYVLSEPGVAASDNDGTLKGFAKGTGAALSFTIEAPGSVSYVDQVLGETELVFHLIDAARV